ncbi:MAG: hypothetical protein L3J32_03405, partial [Rhizobiaceae bacterium]|nr:hypothetical protein [Rhizobiaceae bacterium]
MPNGNGAIPNTYPVVGGTMIVLIGQNGNIYYQFVNPSTQFQGFQNTGTPVAFQGNPFQLGPTQNLNCGPTPCSTYFGGSIVEGYVRLTARDGDACAGNFDFNDVSFELNGFNVASFTGPLTERTNMAGTTSIGFENCFRNQGASETSTAWFDISANTALLNNILTVGSTTPAVFDNDPNDNFWFFRDGNDATGTPEVAPGISIVKTADVTSYSAVGDIINYSFEVHNIGSVTLNNIVVTDTFITGAISCPQTTLVSNATMTCTATHTVTQANIDFDIVFTNVASVAANPTEGTIGNVSGTVSIPGPPANNSMTILKVASSTTNAAVGDTITYAYLVENTGNITLDNVNVSDVHGGTGTLSAISPTNVTLAPGNNQAFTATYLVTQADVDAQAPFANTATAQAVPRRGTIVEPTASASVDVEAAAPAMSLAKSSVTASYSSPGDILAYSYLVTNTGNVSLTSVSVSDDIIDAVPDSVTCPALPPTGIAPLGTITCTATYAVTQADIDSGSVSNTATATNGAVVSAPSSVTINATQSPALAIDKRLNASSPTDFSAVGTVLLYDYEVTNSGNITLSASISVADDVVDAAGGSVSCPPLPGGNLAPGASIICTASYTVVQADMDAGGVTNTASATDGVNTSPDDSLTINAVQSPAMVTTKTAQPILPLDFIVGAVVTYDYTVENTGNITITTPITVSDNLIPSVVCDPLPPGGLALGASLACIGTYTLTSNDILLGSVTNVATSNDGTTTSPSVSETVPNGATPALTLVKTSPTTDYSTVGDIINFDFQVTNTGTAAFVSDIDIIDDTVPASPITCWSATGGDPDFQAGEVTTCSASYTVTQADIDAGSVTNVATANTIFAVTTPVTSPTSSVTVNANQTPSLNVTKIAFPSTFTSVGQAIVYYFSVQNNGNQTISNISFSDPLIPSMSCPTIASLAPGVADSNCVGIYIVTQADYDAGQIDNTGTASGSTPQGNPITDTGTSTIIGPAASPSWTLAKTSTSTPTAAGQMAAYSFTLQNTGDISINSVTLTDAKCDAPPVLSSGDFAPLGQLDVSETWVYSCLSTVSQADVDSGSIDNSASASGTPARGTLADASATFSIPVASAGAIAVVKTAVTSGLSSPVQVGDAISYTFAITNTGNVTLSNIAVTDASATMSGGPLASLAPGATDNTTFTAMYTVTQGDIDAGSFSNQATVTSNPPTGPPVTDLSDESGTGPGDNDPTVVSLPAVPLIGTVKTSLVNDGGDGVVDAGDTITYTYVVTNTGNVVINDIAVTENAGSFTGTGTLPAPTYISGGANLDGDGDAMDIAVGATVTFAASYTLTQGDIDAGDITNQAIATGNPPTGPPVSDLSDESGTGPGDNGATVTPLPASSSIAVVKVSDVTGLSSPVVPGDIITYAFTVVNTGNTTLTGIDVTDTNATMSGGPIASLAPGATDTTTFTAAYTITQG